VNRRLTLAFALLVMILSATVGCEQDHPSLPSPLGGVIRGVVSDGAAIDDDIRITVESVDQETNVNVSDDIGLDGSFALNVPNGKYVVYVRPGGSGTLYYNAAGPVLNSSAADTVVVAGDEHDLSFACGRVTFAVELPATLDGRSMTCNVVSIGESWSYRAYSGQVADGLRVEVRFVPPGLHRLTISGGGFVRVYLPPTFDSEAADVVDVVVGQELVYTAGIAALATLGGSVTGSWQTIGEDPPRVNVWFGEQSIASTNVAADGTFAFTFLAGAPLRLRVWIDSVSQWVGGPDFDAATVFDLENGGAITGIDYVESGLECVLTGDLDDHGFDGVLYDGQGRILGWGWYHADTLRFANLRPGPVYLEIVPDSDASLWLPQFFDRRDSLAVADPIMILPDGQIAPVVAVLVRGARIRGRFLDCLGLPPQRVPMVEICAADDSLRLVRSQYLGFNGSYDEVTGDYVITRVPDGTFKLRACTKEAWTWWPHQPSFAAGGTVTVENHQDVEGVDWELVY
jgi:hypothetical protein